MTTRYHAFKKGRGIIFVSEEELFEDYLVDSDMVTRTVLPRSALRLPVSEPHAWLFYALHVAVRELFKL